MTYRFFSDIKMGNTPSENNSEHETEDEDDEDDDELTYPIYTAAMKSLVLTCCGLDKPEKDRLRFLIERMTGIYSNSFHDCVTHLVTSTVKSHKYEVAVGNETPVMTKEWVEDVWKVSCKDSVPSVAAIDPRCTFIIIF